MLVKGWCMGSGDDVGENAWGKRIRGACCTWGHVAWRWIVHGEGWCTGGILLPQWGRGWERERFIKE